MSLPRSARPVLISSLSALAVVALAVGTVPLGAQSRYEPGRADAAPAYGSGYAYDLPAFVSVVDGYAELDRAGQSSRDIENVPLEAGDRIRTTRGRAEILFDDGSVLAIDEHTTVTVVSASELELVRGRVRAQWQQGASDLAVFTSAGQALLRERGDYRVSLGQARTGEEEIEVAVTRGSAELANDLGRTIVREGTRALTTARYAPSVPYAYSAPRDEFERWTDSLSGDRYGVESVRYLPTELRYYGGVFDRHGSWHQHHSHGWVWYPRVNVGWRPYDGGRWTFVVGFGYSWVGGSRWAWPTHHHGRWDRVGSRYFWIPGRTVQRRVVGYAAPRSSYTATVNYYQRPANYPRPTTRGSQSAGPSRPQASRPEPSRPQPSARPQGVPQRSAPPVAVPRGQSRTPTVGRPPSSDRGQSSTSGARSAGDRNRPSEVRGPQSNPQQPPARTAPQGVPRGQQPSARGEQSSRPSATPPPRTEPRASAPPSGSRTPSRSARPPAASSGSGGGGGDRAQAGTAVRRRGGG
jgi:hypothetical protein